MDLKIGSLIRNKADIMKREHGYIFIQYSLLYNINSSVLQLPEVTNVQNRKPTIQVLSSTVLPSTYQIRTTTCKSELQQLLQQKREQCNAERIAKQMMENAEWESKPPPPGKRAAAGGSVLARVWKPRIYCRMLIINYQEARTKLSLESPEEEA